LCEKLPFLCFDQTRPSASADPNAGDNNSAHLVFFDERYQMRGKELDNHDLAVAREAFNEAEKLFPTHEIVKPFFFPMSSSTVP
jgi:hypothetical protein